MVLCAVIMVKKKEEEEEKNQARSDDLTSDLCLPSAHQRVRALWQRFHPGIKHGSTAASTPAGLPTRHNIIPNSDPMWENVKRETEEKDGGDQSF